MLPAVVSRALGRAYGRTAHETVAIELRGAAVAPVSAAVREGAIARSQAQVTVAKLHAALARAADDAVHSSVPELETCALAHRRADAVLFAR